MASGYEKSPDYGSRPPGKWEIATYVAAFVIVAALVIWLRD